MKKTDVGRGVILKLLLLTTYIHFLKNILQKCQQNVLNKV